MSKTATNPIPLGFQAPNFELPNVLELERHLLTKPGPQQVTVDRFKYQRLSHLKGNKATVIMFICNHCPFVKHILYGLVKLSSDYLPLDVACIAINANDVSKYPEDSPKNMQKIGKDFNFHFPYLYDETQAVAKAYHAACTPDFSIFDANMCCVYRGQFDDARPDNNIPVTGIDIRMALDALVAGRAVSKNQKPSIGCNIKWRNPDDIEDFEINPMLPS